MRKLTVIWIYMLALQDSPSGGGDRTMIPVAYDYSDSQEEVSSSSRAGGREELSADREGGTAVGLRRRKES